MKNPTQFLSATALASLLAVFALPLFTTSTLAMPGPCIIECNVNHNGNIRGAPGPIAGAGLPVLAVGYGVYWLIKRRRRKPD